MKLPSLSLLQLEYLTDDTGIIQHARYAVSDPNAGYTADDNSRALVLTARLHAVRPRKQTEGLLHRYLAFLQYVQRSDGRFMNLVRYDRTVLPEGVSEDCFGRCLWACAEVIQCNSATEGIRHSAHAMLEAALPHVETLQTLRGWANTLLGVSLLPGENGTGLTVLLADRLLEAFGSSADMRWQWFVSVLLYDLGACPRNRVFEHFRLVSC